MAQEHFEKAGIIEFVSQALKICGMIAEAFYHAGKAIAESACDVGKAFAKYAYDIGSYGLEIDEETQLTKIVREYERRTEQLYSLIGRQYPNLRSQEGKEVVSQYVSKVRDYEKTIIRMKERLAELKELQSVIRVQKTLLRGCETSVNAATEEVVKSDKFGAQVKDVGEKTVPNAIFETSAKKEGEKIFPKVIKSSAPDEKETIKAVDAEIAKAVKLDKFRTPAARVMFKKVAADLLDSNLENKVLAVTELGRIGNDAAVPILMAAVNFRHPELISEIIKTLTALDDSRALSLMYDEAANPNYRVRSACLRGLFKLKDDGKEIPVLINGLHDKHHEVRRTAVTLLGWKCRSEDLPELTQCLKDEDAKVRKTAVLALANIKDESSMLPLIDVLGDENLVVREKALEAIRLISGKAIEFDVKAMATDLNDAIDNLRVRFKKKSTTPKKEVVAPAAKPVKEASMAEEETAKIELSKMALTKMKKSELLSFCAEHGIKCDAALTKNEIIEGILAEGKSTATWAKTAKESESL